MMTSKLRSTALFFVALIILSACTPAPQATGTLTGQVTIGPLAPVLREGEVPPTPAPEVYSARQIVIYKPNGTTEVARAELNPQGVYEIELTVGTYVVDTNHLGIDSAAGLPATVEIREGQTTVLDVDIDTGIR
jgi:hypothetical protein